MQSFPEVIKAFLTDPVFAVRTAIALLGTIIDSIRICHKFVPAELAVGMQTFTWRTGELFILKNLV